MRLGGQSCIRARGLTTCARASATALFVSSVATAESARLCRLHLTGLVPAEYDLLKKYCNGWRNFNDIAAAYDSVRGIITFWANEPPQTGWNYSAFQAAAGPGSQNDPDMLMVGGTVSSHDVAGIWVAFFQACQEFRCGQGLSLGQSQLQMALWSVWSAPLLMSNE